MTKIANDRIPLGVARRDFFVFRKEWRLYQVDFIDKTMWFFGKLRAFRTKHYI